MTLLQGRVAVVTGAGRGIGRAEALRLAAYGARVAVNDSGVATDGRPTEETPAAEVANEINVAGGAAITHTGDISTTEGADGLVRSALDRWGRLDIVVNNAGIGRPRMVFNLSDEEWDDVVRVHLRGTFLVCRSACRWWHAEAKAGREVYGRIINTSSGLLLSGGAGQSNYVAAKAGVFALTAAIASEMQPYGVTANTIMPGARTRLSTIGWRAERVADRAGSVDVLDPVHVAELVCFLASPAAGSISGQCFSVRGGLVEHVRSWESARRLESTEPMTAADLARALTGMDSLGAKPADRPPKEWQDSYRSRRKSEP